MRRRYIRLRQHLLVVSRRLQITDSPYFSFCAFLLKFSSYPISYIIGLINGNSAEHDVIILSANDTSSSSNVSLIFKRFNISENSNLFKQGREPNTILSEFEMKWSHLWMYGWMYVCTQLRLFSCRNHVLLVIQFGLLFLMASLFDYRWMVETNICNVIILIY